MYRHFTVKMVQLEDEYERAIFEIYASMNLKLNIIALWNHKPYRLLKDERFPFSTIEIISNEFYNTKRAYSFKKDSPCGPWLNHQPNSAKQIKEGCLMALKGIRNLIKRVRFTGVTVNIGFIGLNFAGGSS